MTEEPKNPQTETAAFFSSLWGKIIALLTAITMIGGIATEGISIYRNWQDSIIAGNKVKESFTEQCAKREKYVYDYIPMGKWDEALDEIKKECDPTYAQRHAERERIVKECSRKFHDIVDSMNSLKNDTVKDKIESHKKSCAISDADRTLFNQKIESITASENKECGKAFESIFNRLQQADKNDEHAFDKVGIELFNHMTECNVTEDQKKRLDTMKNELDTSFERVKWKAAVVVWKKYEDDAKKESDAGHYSAAYDLAKKAKDTIEKQKNGKAGIFLGTAWNSVAWRALFAREYAEASFGFRASNRYPLRKVGSRDQSGARAYVPRPHRRGANCLFRAQGQENWR